MTVKKILLSLIIVLVFVTSDLAYAAGSTTSMASPNYLISSDAIDNGGIYSSSPNYSMEDTVGETGTGVASSSNYAVNGGYQQMTSSSIGISSPGNLTMPGLGGITGGTSTSTLAWTVTTDDSAGYGLYVQSSTAPALRSSAGAAFADYAPAASGTPDYNWAIGAASSSFGFAPQGTDVIATYLNNGSACSTGSSSTAFKCWNGFSTSQKIIAQSAGPNAPTGTATNLGLEAQIGASKIQDAGSYAATITVTAVAL